MGFFSLIVALLLEQARPLQTSNPLYAAIRNLAAYVERNFNAGERQHGVIGWLAIILPLTLGTWLVFEALYAFQPVLAIVWNVLVLYATLGFRQFSHYYTDIQLALANGDLDTARRNLEQWKRPADPKFSAAGLSTSDICRLAIEEALVASHRHVYGVFFWFVLLPGPSGAVLYRLSDYLVQKWNEPGNHFAEPFGQVARRAFGLVDWLPIRLTAVGFAVVGNFEDAVFCWRNNARQWDDAQRGIILAAGSGALGVRLGETQTPLAALAIPVPLDADPADPAHAAQAAASGEGARDAMPGVEASPAALRSTVGLVWRSLVLWMILLLLLSVAGLIG